MAAAGVPIPGGVPHLEPGRRLGPYEILAPLAAGGMGDVYRARDVRLDRIVAVKVLAQRAAGQPGARERFEREARTISSLNHPNICALYDIGLHDHVEFLVMEYLEGQTLAARLQAAPPPPASMVRWAIQIADALDAAHRRGIVHRDLKPSNIILTEAGAKLLDFGVAKLRDQPVAADGSHVSGSAPPALTHHGRLVGTLRYMSPEQVRGADVDARSDLFSFGAVLYEMASGRAPFAGTNTDEITGAILDDARRPLLEVSPHTDPAFAAIVERALECDRDRRYQLASEIRTDLQRLEQGTLPVAPRWFATPLSRIVAAAALVAMVSVAGFRVHQLTPQARASSPPLKSVSVLPFKPLVPGNEENDLGASLADAIVTELGASNTVAVRRVAAGNRYDRPGADPVAAGRELGVDLVVDGALQRDRDRVRASVHVVRVSDGITIWSERFDSEWSDIFSLQDAIAEQVTRALAVTLTSEARQRISRRRTQHPDAYEAYLKGRYFWNMRTGDGFHKALGYFQRAIDADPQYASAYAGLADTYALLGSMPYAVLSQSEAGAKAKAAARRALDLDESLAEAHVSLAFVTYAFDWDWAAGEREFKRAIELDPDYATAHYWYSFFLGQMGRIDEAIAEGRRALEAEPLSLMGAYTIGLANYFGRRFPPSREFGAKVLEITPGFAPGRRLIGSVDIAERRYADAIREFRQLHAAAPDNSLHTALLAYAYGQAGERTQSDELLNGLIAASRLKYVSPANIGLGYIGAGRADAAMKWLEAAYAEHSQALTFLKVDPLYDPLRSDPRFVDLLARLHFPR
jgi:serine/threonine-protein kinase